MFEPGKLKGYVSCSVVSEFIERVFELRTKGAVQ